jgi:acetyl esterase
VLVEPESQMQAVLNCLDELSREPIETLSPEEARRQPSVADAVREVLWQEGSTLSPEPVGALEDVEVPGPYGPIPLRIYWPLWPDPLKSVHP